MHTLEDAVLLHMVHLRGALYTLGRFSTIICKGDNLWDFLFPFENTKPIFEESALKKKKKKKKNLFRADPFSGERKTIFPKLSSQGVYPFFFTIRTNIYRRAVKDGPGTNPNGGHEILDCERKTINM